MQVKHGFDGETHTSESRPRMHLFCNKSPSTRLEPIFETWNDIFNADLSLKVYVFKQNLAKWFYGNHYLCTLLQKRWTSFQTHFQYRWKTWDAGKTKQNVLYPHWRNWIKCLTAVIGVAKTRCTNAWKQLTDVVMTSLLFKLVVSVSDHVTRKKHTRNTGLSGLAKKTVKVVHGVIKSTASIFTTNCKYFVQHVQLVFNSITPHTLQSIMFKSMGKT